MLTPPAVPGNTYRKLSYLESVFHSAGAYTRATAGIGRPAKARTDSTFQSRESVPGEQDFLRNARVRNAAGTQLAAGVVASIHEGGAGDLGYSISSSIRARTAGRITPGMSALAWSNSATVATYRIEEACSFDLRVHFAGIGDADVVFRIVDLATQETVFELDLANTVDLAAGESMAADYRGMLAAGRYQILTKGATTSRRGDGIDSETGGDAAFGLELLWGVKTLDYGGGLVMSMSSQTPAIPEPASLLLLSAPFALLTLRRRG